MKKIVLFISTFFLIYLSIFLPTDAQEVTSTGAELTLIEVTGVTSGEIYSSTTTDNQFYYEIDSKKDNEVYFKFEAAEQSVIRFRSIEDPSGNELWENPIDTKSYPVGHTYYVTVIAYEGTPVKEYVIHIDILDDRNTDATLKDLVVRSEDKIFEPTEPILSYASAGTYVYDIPYAYTSISIVPTTNYEKAIVYQNQDKLAWKSNVDIADVAAMNIKEVSLWVQAENESWSTNSSGDPAPYHILLRRLMPSTDAFLKNLMVDGQPLEEFTTSDKNKTYEMIVDHGMTALAYHMELPEYATSNVAEDGIIPIENGIGQLEIVVTSEDGSFENHYTILVYAADTDFEITNIRILDYDKSFEIVDGKEVLKELVDITDDHGETIYQFNMDSNPELSFIYTLQYSDPTPYLYIECKSSYAHIYGGGKIEVEGGKEEAVVNRIYAVSEYGILKPSATDTRSRTYQFEFYRTPVSEENHINTLYFVPDAGLPSNLKVSPSGGIGDKEISTIYVANVLPETTKLDVEVMVVSDKSFAYINGSTTPSLTGSVPIVWSIQNDFKFNIVIVAESGARRTYEVVVTMDHLENFTDHTIVEIELTTDQNQTFNYDFTSDKPAVWKLNGFQNECSIKVVKPDYALSTIWVKLSLPDGTTKESNDLSTTFPLQIGTTKLTVYAVSMSGEESKHYTVDIIKEELSDNVSLDYIIVNGVKVSNVQREMYFYYAHGTSEALIEAYSSHFAKITIAGKEENPLSVSLVTGKNDVTITVVSQSSKVTMDYRIHLEVDERIEIENISIVTDESLPLPDFQFDKEVFEYNLTIPYAVKQIRVDYQLAQGIDETLLTISGVGLIETKDSKDVSILFQTKTGVSKEYILHLTKIPASKDNELLSLTINDIVIQGNDFDENNYTQIILDRTTTTIEIKDISVASLATYQLFENLQVEVGKNERHILVTSESLETRDYRIDIFCANHEVQLDNLELFNKDNKVLEDVNGQSLQFESSTFNYSFEVSYFNDKLKLKVLKDDYSILVLNQIEYHETELELNLANIGHDLSNDFTVMLISEATHYGYQGVVKTPTYTIQIKRRVLGTENKIEKYINELGQEMAIIDDLISYEVTHDVVSFHPTLELSTSARAEYPVDVELKDGSNVFIIKVYAENGNVHQYMVDIFKTSLKPITMTIEFMKKEYTAYETIAKEDVIVTLLYSDGSSHVTREFEFNYSESHPYLEVGLEQLTLMHKELMVPVPVKDNIVISALKIAKPQQDNHTYTYTGSGLTYQIEESQWYDISNHIQTDAGNYSVMIRLKDSSNTVWDDGSIADLNYEFVIAKAVYDLSGISISDQTFVYDGNPHQMQIVGNLPQGVSVYYQNETQTNVGTYDVEVSFEGDIKNYQAIDLVLTAQLTIAPLKIKKPKKDVKEYTYTGCEQTYQIEESQWYTVVNQTQKDAGTYAVLIRLKDSLNTVWDDDSVASITYEFVIEKAVYDLSGISISNQAFVYDGKPHQMQIVGNLPQGVSAKYKNETQTNVGTYDVEVSFEGDIKNYQAIDLVLTATLMILPTMISNQHVTVIDSVNGFPVDAVLVLEKLEHSYHGAYHVEEAYQLYVVVGEEKRPVTEQMEVRIQFSSDRKYHVLDGTTFEEVDAENQEGVLCLKGRSSIIIAYETSPLIPYQWTIPYVFVILMVGCLFIYLCRKKVFFKFPQN